MSQTKLIELLNALQQTLEMGVNVVQVSDDWVKDAKSELDHLTCEINDLRVKGLKLMSVTNHIHIHGRQKSSEMLDYRPELLDKLAKRGAVVIDGKVFAPVTKRVTRGKKL